MRRSRALLAWALVAWLALVGMAFAQADCCTGEAMQHHGMHAHHHGGMASADCACVHAPATVPVDMAFVSPLTPRLPAQPMLLVPAAPQPDYAPPLRPPVAFLL